MKKTIIIGILTLVVAVTTLAFAQKHEPQKMRQGAGRDQFMGELTEEQQAEFKKMRMKLTKEIQPLKLQIEKMNVELKELLIVDKVNLSRIEKKVDDISALKAKIQKITLKNKLAMRELLDDEQKLMFNRQLLQNKRDQHHHGPDGNRPGRRRMGGRRGPDMPDEEDIDSPE